MKNIIFALLDNLFIVHTKEECEEAYCLLYGDSETAIKESQKDFRWEMYSKLDLPCVVNLTVRQIDNILKAYFNH